MLSGEEAGRQGWTFSLRGHEPLPASVSFLLTDHQLEKPVPIILDPWLILRVARGTSLPTPFAGLVAKEAGVPLKPSEVREWGRTFLSYSVSLYTFEFLQM